MDQWSEALFTCSLLSPKGTFTGPVSLMTRDTVGWYLVMQQHQWSRVGTTLVNTSLFIFHCSLNQYPMLLLWIICPLYSPCVTYLNFMGGWMAHCLRQPNSAILSTAATPSPNPYTLHTSLPLPFPMWKVLEASANYHTFRFVFKSLKEEGVR